MNKLTLILLEIIFLCLLIIVEIDPTLQDFFNKQTMVDSEVVDLEILDTAGQVAFSFLFSFRPL